MFFTILDRYGSYQGKPRSKVFLTWDNWNDYSFLTLYGIFYVDEDSVKHELGGVKIGYYGQKEGDRQLAIGDTFDNIGENFFSVGTDDDYYEKLNELGEVIRDNVLKGLNDIAKDPEIYDKAILEAVTRVSFLRSVSETTIVGQFRRLAMGASRLTSYHFEFITATVKDGFTPMTLSFHIKPNSLPPTNIHVLIGRNGVGKTYLINNMISALTEKNSANANFGTFNIIESDTVELFANLICVTFSAFDEFEHPPEKRDKSLGIQYSYIGLKSEVEEGESSEPKNPGLLRDEFVKSIYTCKLNSRVSRWKRAIAILESDPIFKEANITNLIDEDERSSIELLSTDLFNRLSSGHKIVLLTITRLVETLQEKSLVLLDEPESHLHPPLLASFTRALSDLLINRNGVSIVATHSPVILQEVPRSCVWKLRRNGGQAIAERLEIESFGENVGILTQEVFGLEVTDSGFHTMLKELVKDSDSYEDAIGKLEDQLGLEARAILRSLFYQKTKPNEGDY